MKDSYMKKGKQNWMERVSRHPLILLAGLVVAVVALIVMIALFFVSQTDRKLVYAVNPVRTMVVTAEQAKGIEIIYKGLELRDTDITIAQIAIWNSGDQSIRKENILEDCYIYTEPPVKILEAKIVNMNRGLEITNFSLPESPGLKENGRVAVSWNILEKGDGASVQLTYLGSPEVQIKVEGVIEGFGVIKRVGKDIKIKSPTEQFESSKTPWWVVYLFFPIVGIVMTWSMGREILKAWNVRRKAAIIEIGFAILFYGWMGFGLWQLMSGGPLEPPFGF